VACLIAAPPRCATSLFRDPGALLRHRVDIANDDPQTAKPEGGATCSLLPEASLFAALKIR
jgi:hypothetical protein